MTDRHYYKHAETGIVSLIADSAAEVFGDRLVRVDDPNAELTPESPKPTRAPKKATNTDDSPDKEGNE